MIWQNEGPFEGVRLAIMDALRMDLPAKVTILHLEQETDIETCLWRVRVTVPGKDDIIPIEVKQAVFTPFPFDEMLTKIRMFL